jgi:hypothetical protein
MAFDDPAGEGWGEGYRLFSPTLFKAYCPHPNPLPEQRLPKWRGCGGERGPEVQLPSKPPADLDTDTVFD